MTKNKLFFSKKQINSAIKKIPAKDFADASFDLDEDNRVNPSGLLIILSTPRSGSTLICDLLRDSEFCMAHEYFQMDEYMPLLASRWACLKNGYLQKREYIIELSKHRTMKSGWLGVNLHGRHLPTFLEFSEFLPKVKTLFIRIRRKNIIQQAISYEIAKQTGKWSSEFGTNINPEYCFEDILKRISELNYQNSIIDAYIEQYSLDVCDVYYEDFIKNPKAYLASFLPIELNDFVSSGPTLVRQRSNINSEWEQRLNKDLLTFKGKPKFLKRYFF